MSRSAAAALAALILPGYVAAQDPQPTPPLQVEGGTHTVVDYDTLWDLAQVYLNDPWQWPRIWDANRALVDNPDLIFPGWELVIPGLMVEGAEGTEGEVTDVRIEVGPTTAPAPQRTDLSQRRSIFYEDPDEFRQRVEALAVESYAVISRDQVYSAPWLIPLYTEPESMGVLEGAATERVSVGAIRAYTRVRLSLDEPTVRVGDLMQIYRVSRDIPGVGRVVQPVGMLTVSELDEGGAIAIVTKEYGRILTGDLVRPAPVYDIEADETAELVAGGSEAVILGFQGTAELHSVNSVAFLDVGSDQGVAIGDVFELFDPQAGSGVAVGAMRVVGTTTDGAAARIVHIDGDVFAPGVVVQLTRKMR